MRSGSQWRAAASVPRSVHEARQSLHQEFDEHHKQITVLVNQLEQVTSANLRDQKKLVDKLAADSARAIAEFNSWRFYDCHETLEDIWREVGGKGQAAAELAGFYQGIIKSQKLIFLLLLALQIL